MLLSLRDKVCYHLFIFDIGFHRFGTDFCRDCAVPAGAVGTSFDGFEQSAMTGTWLHDARPKVKPILVPNEGRSLLGLQ